MIVDNYKKYVLSTKFWWTPEQIETLSIEEFEYYFAFIKADNLRQEQEYKEMERKNKRNR